MWVEVHQEHYCIRSKNSLPFVQQINSSFEAIRARMKKTIGGDEHLDFLDKTLERRGIIRIHSYIKPHAVLAALERDRANSVTIWT